jgi:hypothetical protein
MLAEGDAAPGFALPDQDGNEVSLAALKGGDDGALLLSPGRHPRLHDTGLRGARPGG